jgi:hypothetical protein
MPGSSIQLEGRPSVPAHRSEAVKKLEEVNAARQIAEFEKKKNEANKGPATVPENPANFSGQKTEESQRIN